MERCTNGSERLHMEQPHTEKSHFVSKEQLEETEFYRDWIKKVFMNNTDEMKKLVRFRNQLAFIAAEQDWLSDSHGLSLEPIQSLLQEVLAKINQVICETEADLQRDVFDAQLFKVGILIDGQVRLVESVVARDERILPVVQGEPFTGKIDDVLFDR